jgi:hypothetical protein
MRIGNSLDEECVVAHETVAGKVVEHGKSVARAQQRVTAACSGALASMTLPGACRGVRGLAGMADRATARPRLICRTIAEEAS